MKLYLEYPAGKIPKGELCECCARFNNRHITCSVVAVKDSSVLLMQRDHNPMMGYWGLPGGYLDWGETIEECAARELQEETGLRVQQSDLALLRVSSSPTRDEDGRQNVEMVFVAQNFSGELQPEVGEVADLQWYTFDQLPDEIAFDHRHVLQQVQIELQK